MSKNLNDIVDNVAKRVRLNLRSGLMFEDAYANATSRGITNIMSEEMQRLVYFQVKDMVLGKLQYRKIYTDDNVKTR